MVPGRSTPSTGAATISFTGKLWVNFYSGLSPFFIQDPVVTVQSNGDGTVVGTMGGFAADRDNPTAPALPIADVANVTISDLSGVASNNTTGFVTTPDYAGHPDHAAGGCLAAEHRRTPSWARSRSRS